MPWIRTIVLLARIFLVADVDADMMAILMSGGMGAQLRDVMIVDEQNQLLRHQFDLVRFG